MSVIQIKRSTVTATPASLAVGELAYSSVSNSLFIGEAGNVVTKIGGKSVVDGLANSVSAAITVLSGDVAAAGPGSVTATIQPKAVTLAKMADVATASILGRNTAGNGVVEVLNKTQVRAMLDITNVDNTTDLNKPISTAAQGALNAKAPINNPVFTGTVGGIDKTMVGLTNVDNTTDLLKPISTATQTAISAKAPINNPTFTGTVGGITKAMVGLTNVDDTTDANKPLSTAAVSALAAKAPLASPTFTGTVGGITKSMVGLTNVDDTSDINKPISTATQNALNAKAPLANPTFTGTVNGINKAMVGLANVDDTTDANKPISIPAQNALNLKAPIASPVFTGTVTLPADPTLPMHAVTKQYADSIAAGFTPKQACRVATTANITLSGLQTIDTISVIAGDRVLVKTQTTATQNGIYIAAAGAWTRASDFDGTPAAEVVQGAFTFASEGAANGGNGFIMITASPVLGTSNINWTQFSGAGEITSTDSTVTVQGNNIDLPAKFAGSNTFRSVTVNKWGVITAGTNPTTIAEYAISDAYTKTEVGVQISSALGSYTTTSGMNSAITTALGPYALSTALNGYSLTSHVHAFSTLTSLPATVAAHGINDVYTKTEIATQISSALSTYTNTSGMNGAITTALGSYTNTTGMNGAISTALASYSTTAVMNTAITNAIAAATIDGGSF